MRIFGIGKKAERVEEPKTFDGDGAEVKDFRRAKKGKCENVPDAAWGKGKEMTLSEAQAVWDKLVPRKGIGGPGIKVNVKDYRKGGLVGRLTDANGDKVDVGDAEEGVFEDDKLPKNVRFNPFLASGISPKVMEYFGTRMPIGYNMCAFLATHELISPCLIVPAKDAIAKGYKIEMVGRSNDDKGGSDDGGDAATLEEIKKESENNQYQLSRVLRRHGLNERMFGVAYTMPIFKETEDERGNKVPFDYSKPFNAGEIPRDSYLGMKVIEPEWVSGYEFTENGSNSPIDKSFYEPEFYHIGGLRRVHRSWIVKSVYMEVSDLFKPSYYYGGPSLPQLIFERIYCGDKIANEVPMLVMTKRLLVADANVSAMVDDKKVAQLTMDALNYFRDNYSVFFKNPNTQVTQIDTSLEGLPQAGMFEYQLAAAISGIPVTKILKNVPTGLQSTGDYEMDDYHELLGEIQKEYEGVMDMHFKCYTQSKYGHVIDIKVTWNPLQNVKREQQTQEEGQLSSCCSTYLNSHLMTRAELREAIRKREGGWFAGISKDMPPELAKFDEADAKQAEQQANQMGGMPPGAPQPGDPNNPESALSTEAEEQLRDAAAAEAALEEGGEVQ